MAGAGFDLLLKAASYSAAQHRDQRRKDINASPYINHPIQVAEVLASVGVENIELLCASLLHDTIEDTDSSEQDIERLFGAEILGLVKEVTDDKTLSKEMRKQRQVESASRKSRLAKQLKIADKLCNVRDINLDSPRSWSDERKQEYLDWAESVVAGCRGVNENLDQKFDEALARSRDTLRK